MRKRRRARKPFRPMGKRITMDKDELEAIRKKRKNPDGIYYDKCKVKTTK